MKTITRWLLPFAATCLVPPAFSNDQNIESAGATMLSDETKGRRGALEEIIVTAQKRTESIQDVPVSVTALGNMEIGRRGLVGMSDYLRTLPGVNQIETGGPGNNSIIMRGISSAPQTVERGAKATVGYYLNDVPLTGYTFRGGADVKLIDLARVEVIRGPQGTLYGNASLGGAVRNIPNAPDLTKLEGYAKGGYSYTSGAGSENSSVEGVLNLPVIQGKLALRAVGYRFDNSGYVENIAGTEPSTLARASAYGIADLALDQEDVGANEYVGGRVAVLFQPTDKLTATLTYLTQDITQKGLNDSELIWGGEYQQARFQLGEIAGGGSETQKDNLDVYSALLEYRFTWGALLSSSAWVRERFLEKRDIGAAFGGAPVPQNNPGETEAFVQELRFASDFDGPMQLLVGLYYDDVDRRFRSRNYYGGRNLALNPFPQIVLGDVINDNVTRQKAVFGEISYKLGSSFKLTLGARQFNYDTTITDTTIANAFGSPGVATLEGENEGNTFKVNLAYQPSALATLYAQWSQGFRLGSPLAPAPSICDRDTDGLVDGTSISSAARTLDPDDLDSYELGAKLTLMEGSLVINGAAYRNDWRGVPVRVILAGSLCTPEANAGEARTQGAELESEYYLTRDLRLSVAASYLDAELSEDAPGIGGLAGDRLPGTPKYTLNMGAQYQFVMFGLPSYVRGDYAHVGEYYNNLKQTGVPAGDYGLLNVRAGTTFNRIAFDLFVNNATNSDEPTWVDAVYRGSYARVYRLRPRTIGVNASIKF